MTCRLSVRVWQLLLLRYCWSPERKASVWLASFPRDDSPSVGGAQGQASDIEITAREILKVKKELYTIISTHSGQPYEKVEHDSDRDYWMTAEEALAYGMIDKVLVRNK